MQTIEQTIQDLIPASLDNIIRQNRDQCALYLTTHDEVQALPPMISAMANPKRVTATIHDWRLINLKLSQTGRAKTMTMHA